MIKVYSKHLAVFLLMLFLFLLNTSSPGYAGIPDKADSLRSLVKKGGMDAGKLSLVLAELARELMRKGEDSCRPVALWGLNLAEKAGYSDGILRNSATLGLLYMFSDSLVLARKYLLKAKGLMHRNTDAEYKMKILNGLGYISDLQSDFGSALNYYMLGKIVAEESGKNLWRADFLNNIAAIYNAAGEYVKSAALFKEASEIFLVNKDSAYYANSLVNIGRAYLGLKKSDSASEYYKMALPIQKRLKNYYGLANLNLGLASVCLQNSRINEALDFLKTGRANIDSLDKTFHGSTLFLRVDAEEALGDVYQKMKKFKLAENHYKNALKLARQGSFLQFETAAVTGISEIMEMTGRTDSAIYYSKLHFMLADSLWKIRNNQKIVLTELEFTFKSQQEKQRLENAREQEINSRNTLIFILSISLALGAAMVLLLLYLLQRAKGRRMNLVKKNLELEKISLEKDIALKDKELLLQSMNLAENKEAINEMSRGIQSIIDTDGKDDNPLRKLLHDFHNISSERFWDEFNAHFRDVHPLFYSSLTRVHPGLTPNEIKLCAFIRLNLTTKEIIQLTRKSENTIKIARHRLRHKLGLERNENLTAYLNRY